MHPNHLIDFWEFVGVKFRPTAMFKGHESQALLLRSGASAFVYYDSREDKLRRTTVAQNVLVVQILAVGPVRSKMEKSSGPR